MVSGGDTSFPLLVGILVTLFASLRPAIRATRVPPIAAVREGAELPPGRLARFRTVGTVLLAGIGFAAIAYGLFADGLGTTEIRRTTTASVSSMTSSPPS